MHSITLENSEFSLKYFKKIFFYKGLCFSSYYRNYLVYAEGGKQIMYE